MMRVDVDTGPSACSESSGTLVVGETGRQGADRLALDPAGEPLNPVAGRYAEMVLQTPLEDLPDAWTTLRALSGHLCPDGVLTLHSVARGKLAFRRRDIVTLLRLAGFEPFHWDRSHDSLRVRARSAPRVTAPLTCTVVVPCRDEADNIEPLVGRLPALGTHTELIFVDGASRDGTPERVREVARNHPDRDIKLLHQAGGNGKAAAVFQGFDAAQGDVLIVLDADMAVAPEDLPRFYLALSEGITDFANGTRFAYPIQAGAMRPLNRVGNRIFVRLMSWLLGSPVGDTLCGTKAVSRADWRRIAAVRPALGGHDPWGDFDLLQGAALCGLKIADVPVRYYARIAGESKMQPLRHGLALTRSCIAGFFALKAPRRRSG